MENRTLLFLAQCSKEAYRLKPNRWTKLDIKVKKYLKDQDNQIRGFIAVRGEETIISIKGTASLADAGFDAEVLQTNFYGTQVHSGFHDCFAAVWPDIRDYLHSHHTRKIYVTGHSLGAAIASLIAVAIVCAHSIQPSVATFGSPRVGDDAFVKMFNSLIPDSTRVVHEFDIVTRIPKIDYAHVNNVLHLNDKGRTVGKMRSAFHFIAELCQIGKILIADLDGKALDNHKMNNYLRVVKQYATSSSH